MRRVSWSVAMLLGWVALAQAQGIPVYDNTNFLQNIITAAESTISAVEAVTQTAQGVLNPPDVWGDWAGSCSGP